MPTSFGFLPAALRSRLARVVTFFLMLAAAAPTHGSGLASFAHAVTSLPPIETVISATLPRWLRRKRSAAFTWVVVYFLPPIARALGAQPFCLRIDTVVAPPQPKLTSLSL